MKTWNVQLAKPIDDAPIPSGAWFALTQKLNGVRGTFCAGAVIGRSGAAYAGLEHIAEALKPFGGYVFDGELTLADPGDLTDSEAFRAAAGLVRRKSGDKSNLALTIFDALPQSEFERGRSDQTYRQRRELLDSFAERFSKTSCVRVLPALYQGDDPAAIAPLLDKMTAEGKEGLIANLDTAYQCKRNAGILKIKRFYTMDLPVLRAVEGAGELAGTLGALIVGFNGCEVGVGTGFTREERDELWFRRDKLPGALCEVKYKEISANKQGGQSLQFPSFVSLRPDKREISVPASGLRALKSVHATNGREITMHVPDTAIVRFA